MLAAAEEEPDDRFRRTLKEHVNERTSEQELNERRARQRSRRRASITEQPDGMFHLFAQFDPLVGNQVRAALVAKADALFRSEDLKQRSTPPQRFADALAGLVCSSAGTEARGGAGADGDADTGRGGTEARGGTGAAGHADTGRGNSGACSGAGCGGAVPQGFELIVLADYDLVHERIINARLDRRDPPHRRPRPSPSPATPRSCRASSTSTPAPSSSAAHNARSPSDSASASSPGTAAASAAAPTNRSAKSTTSSPGPTAAQTTYDNTCLLCWRCHQVRVHQHGEQITRHPNGTIHPRTAGRHPTCRACGSGRWRPDRRARTAKPRAADTAARTAPRPATITPRPAATPPRPATTDADHPPRPQRAQPAPQPCRSRLRATPQHPSPNTTRRPEPQDRQLRPPPERRRCHPRRNGTRGWGPRGIESRDAGRSRQCTSLARLGPSQQS